MGRAKRLGAGGRSAGLAIEYVRGRKVVRLLGWMHDETIEPVEIPIEDLTRRLGIEPADLGVPRRFLLFAGSHRRPAGGLRDLVGTFDSEDKAWAAFRELRQNHPSVQGWAELAAIDGMGHVNQMAWFGLHPATEPCTEAPPERKITATKGPKQQLRRILASGDGEPYLRAVTPS